MSTIVISNRNARRLWLERQGLAAAPTGPADEAALSAIIERLGFVQLDTIRIVARAHDHILWSRNQNYRELMLDDLVKDRTAFEHFTHDASTLPIEIYPYWRRQFDRQRRRVEKSRWREFMPPKRERDKILKRIEQEGPLSTRDFEGGAVTSRKEGWVRPAHKFALDYFWYAGVLATCHRKNFIKHYDIAERVIPENHRKRAVAERAQVDWLCENALERMGFASEGDIQRFWDAVDLAEVRAWTKRRSKDLVEVAIETTSGGQKALAFGDIEDRLEKLKSPTSRLRLLNPFDPVIRDRKRLEKLFSFDYRNEMFTPAAKRQYGYYIYPMLEGDRFVGRIEVKADRKAGRLRVDNVWWEPGVKPSPARLKKLDAELERMGRFVDARDVKWTCKRR